MATVATNVSEAVYQIKRWRGVNVAGLLSSYTAEAVGPELPLFVEQGASTLTLTLYPGVEADGMGVLRLTGTPETVDAEGAGSHVGWYYADGAGRVYRFEGLAGQA